jgi:hypothetical protein
MSHACRSGLPLPSVNRGYGDTRPLIVRGPTSHPPSRQGDWPFQARTRARPTAPPAPSLRPGCPTPDFRSRAGSTWCRPQVEGGRGERGREFAARTSQADTIVRCGSTDRQTHSSRPGREPAASEATFCRTISRPSFVPAAMRGRPSLPTCLRAIPQASCGPPAPAKASLGCKLPLTTRPALQSLRSRGADWCPLRQAVPVAGQLRWEPVGPHGRKMGFGYRFAPARLATDGVRTSCSPVQQHGEPSAHMRSPKSRGPT